MQTAVATETSTRVLILDDDAEMAALMAKAARRAGFEPTVATTARQFDAALTDEFAIILIDLMMPERDGIQVVRELAARECRAGIVLVSSVASRILSAAERLVTGQGLRLLGSLSKPFETSELSDILCSPIPETADKKKRAGGKQYDIDATELRRGLEADEFLVHFQPKIAVKTLDFVAVEALARWKHPEHGIIGPGHFVELAERSKLIGNLTEAVIRHAFSQCATWLNAGLALKVAVNVSTRSLGDLELPEWFEEQTRIAGINPRQVVIEITESWLGRNPLASLDILTRLRMKGFSLSIDDFGTGYSTMLKLKTIPFSELKLDQSFIRDAASDTESRYIVESSIGLGQKLGLHLVAEGIERQEDWDLISELGCDEGQGYFIARPMRGGDVPNWLRRWKSYLGQT